MGQWRWGRFAVLFFAVVPLLGAPERARPATSAAPGEEEVVVADLRVDERTQAPTIVLQSKRDKRTVSMVIGRAEAAGIAFPLQNLKPPRPLTHDLFLTLFGRLHVSVTKVVITDLRDGIYYATLYLSIDGTPAELDSRPSDAIALALRAKAPVYAEERVFDKAERAPGRQDGPGSRI